MTTVVRQIPEKEDELLSRLSVAQLELCVVDSVAALTQVLRFLHVLHEVLIRRTYTRHDDRYSEATGSVVNTNLFFFI